MSRLGKARFAREQRGALWLIICARVSGTIFEGGLPDRSPIWSYLARCVYSIHTKRIQAKESTRVRRISILACSGLVALGPFAVCCFLYL